MSIVQEKSTGVEMQFAKVRDLCVYGMVRFVYDVGGGRPEWGREGRFQVLGR